MNTFPKTLRQKTNPYEYMGQTQMYPDSFGQMMTAGETLEYMVTGPELPEQICKVWLIENVLDPLRLLKKIPETLGHIVNVLYVLSEVAMVLYSLGQMVRYPEILPCIGSALHYFGNMLNGLEIVG